MLTTPKLFGAMASVESQGDGGFLARAVTTSARGTYAFGDHPAEALESLAGVLWQWVNSSACKYKTKEFTGVAIVVMSGRLVFPMAGDPPQL